MPTFANGGTKATLRGLLNDTGLRKNNYANSAAPLVTNNASQGYEVGSHWIFGGQLYVLTGFSGSDATWVVPTGLSAYDVAVANGFVGTEAEWLTSLEGTDGIDGADGADGDPGADGADGTSANVVTFTTDAAAQAHSTANPLDIVISTEV